MTYQGFLHLADDAFWAPKVDLDPQMSLLMRSRRAVLALDAPRQVDVRSRASLPVAVLEVTPYELAFDWTFRDHVLAVACEVERFQCLAGLAMPVTRHVVRGPPREFDPELRGTSSGEDGILDLRRSLELPWEPGTWQLLLVTRDRRSEPARVVLHAGGAIPPAHPTLPGAHLTLSVSGEGREAVLDVTVKVRASRTVLGGGEPGEPVGIPVTLVITGHNRPFPYVVRRIVAGRWGRVGEPEHVVASIRIALKELVSPAEQDSAPYYVWAFAGDQVSNPVRVALP